MSLAAAVAQASPDCDAPAAARVLKAESLGKAMGAEAVWIDERRIRWPAAPPEGNYRLVIADPLSDAIAVGELLDRSSATQALQVDPTPVNEEAARAISNFAAGATLTAGAVAAGSLRAMHKKHVMLVQLDDAGRVLRATRVQAARALDSLFADSAEQEAFGVTRVASEMRFRLWAPTARRVALCSYSEGLGAATQEVEMSQDILSGSWLASMPALKAPRYYTYLVDVWVPGTGLVRNRVTDPYSISLTTNSTRSYAAALDDSALQPAGWKAARRPGPLASQTDLGIYELHVRDFSASDASVPAAHRGKYLAFTHADSAGMRHLAALAKAGLTDLHLLPVFDIATIPESGCVTPDVKGAPNGTTQRVAVAATKAADCYNWGYDPFHYTAPEGSYATDAADGATRVREFRQMVMALHGAGLRVGMDVVYNHTSASGQAATSVLDRIVPGYYHRLNAKGEVETSTCCANTATEHRMMEKLMSDSVVAWARHYRIDSFRFDLMGHLPRAAMERLRDRLRRELGREIPLIGEGWNFGEVADGKRFEQASQLALAGSGIGTFSDRARDAARGGGHADSGADLVAKQGFLNGLHLDPNEAAGAADTTSRDALLAASDLLRAGLAGSVRDYVLIDRSGARRTLAEIDYHGQPAGYVAEPAEVVNYVENHDNQTLFDLNALRLPRGTSREERARVQVLGGALTAFSQGVAYFHAGLDILRSKSLDKNSFDSGDAFNRLDWTYRGNHFGAGLPPVEDGGRDDAILKAALSDARIAPGPREIAFARDAFRDLLRIRASSTLFRLRTAQDVRERLTFFNTGPDQVPGVIAAHVDGQGYAGAKFKGLVYAINAGKRSERVVFDAAKGKAFVLHPVQRATSAADRRVAKDARFDARTGAFTIPARSAVVFVQP